MYAACIKIVVLCIKSSAFFPQIEYDHSDRIFNVYIK